jgi:chitinase
VNYATTSLLSDDYLPAAGVLTFAPGETVKTLAVLVIGDTVAEPDENLGVQISNPVGATILGNSIGLCTIVNDDPLPEIRVSDTSVVEGNSGPTTAVFTVNLSEPAAHTIEVDYRTPNVGTAVPGEDYWSAFSTVVFAPGETVKTFEIWIQPDRLPEADETFLVEISTYSAATVVDGQAVGTIVNDDVAPPPPPPTISIGDVTKAEGRKGRTTSFTFTVTLSAPSETPVTIAYRTVNGTAKTSNGDYVAKSGTITFAPGETTKTITITVKGDSKREANEYFYLDLTDPSGTFLFAKRRGVGTILNDD